MTIKEICFGSGGALLLLMTLVQIAPIKVNPWSTMLGWIGKQVNKDLCSNVDSMRKEIKTMQSDIDTIRDESRENNAKGCRVRILRFSDEIYLGQPHSHEHYKQVLTDITHYEKYCAMHPEFENQIAIAAIEQIKDSYSTRLRNHDFLK